VKVFFDTSALAKRYIAEQASEKVIALCQEADDLVVSVVCLPELISTFCRLVREKKLIKPQYRKLKADAMYDLGGAHICLITDEVLGSAIPLLEAHALRSSDALHVACALAVEPDLFVSADHRQLSAAKKSGLTIVDVS
jgi:predicted nucleic acid-binding protein